LIKKDSLMQQRLAPVSAALLAVFGLMPGAHAQSLKDLYEGARSYDAPYLAARSQYDAALARGEGAKAALLPTANLTAGLNRTQIEPRVNGQARPETFSTGQQIGVSANQPLYRPANWVGVEQGQRQVDAAGAQLAVVEQDLIVRITTAYFDVLASQDSLTFVRAQKTAVAEQLAAAKRNFEVGTSTITDTREAQARFDLVLAQEIAAENDLRVKRLALDSVTGRSNAQPLTLAAPVNLPGLTPDDVNVWVGQAENEHPQVRAAAAALDIAKLETERARTGHKPTLDMTASSQLSRSLNNNLTPDTHTRSQTHSIGFALNVPLFAGFSVQNRIKETAALEDKARSDLDNARRTVAQATRTAYFGVVSGRGQVKALEAAEASSQSALDANKLGYQVGVRINIDVLNAQSQLFQTKRDLARARYDVLVGGLRLRQASGTLKPEDLNAVDAQLAR
jgi:outer membrane protein